MVRVMVSEHFIQNMILALNNIRTVMPKQIYKTNQMPRNSDQVLYCLPFY